MSSRKFYALTSRALVSSLFSATLSMCSSVFVMMFILRSNSKLRDAYHRIMFFMSFWDFVSSLAIAFTTLPMPADVNTIYDFSGKAFGAISTCEAQAFLFVIGSAFTVSANCALNLYYVFTIWLGMREERFNKIALPFLLVLAIVISIPPAIVLLHQDLLNPVPFYPYCAVGVYPNGCDVKEDMECIRGAGPGKRRFEINLGIYLSSGMVIILGSMILVISAVFRIEIKQRNTVRRANGGNGNDNNNSDGDFNRTRAVLHQGLMYIAAFLLTWVWAVVATIYSIDVDPLKFIFQPLQGFFNAFIFAYSKAKILQRASRGRLTFWQSMEKVITSPKAVPDIFVSSLEMIELGGHSETELVHGDITLRRNDDPPDSILDSMDTPTPPMDGGVHHPGRQIQLGCNDDISDPDLSLDTPASPGGLNSIQHNDNDDSDISKE